MGHGIMATDRAAFAQRAWHGLGEVLGRPMTVNEAYAKSMDFDIEESMALAGTFGDGAERVVTDTHKMLRRSDTKGFIGVVSSGFHVFQNRHLRDLGNDLVGESALACESGFTMFDGRQSVLLLRAEAVTLGTGDQHVPYMLLANGHDGSLALTVLPTLVRVVCRNTLTAAIGARGAMAGGFRWKHTSGLGGPERSSQIRNAVRQWQLGTDRLVTVGKRLAGARLTRDQVSDLWLEVVQRQMKGEIPSAAEASTDKAKRRRREKAIEALGVMSKVYDRERSEFGDNAYVAANAATNWLQHEAGRRKGEARFDANVFGPVADETRAIMDRALELIG